MPFISAVGPIPERTGMTCPTFGRDALAAGPICPLKTVGLTGVEPVTSRLSGVRSNRI